MYLSLVIFLTEFWQKSLELFLEMAIWLLLGFLFAGLFKAFIPANWLHKNFGKSGWKSVFKATLTGVPLPLCSCGVLPTAVSIHKNGASPSATNAFLISTPQTGVDSMFATYSLMGWPFAILRPFIALVSGWIGGLATLFFGENVVSKEASNAPSVKSEPTTLKDKIKITFRYGFVEMVEDIAKWLIIGILLAGFISALIPDNFFNSVTGGSILMEFTLVLLISIPLYICATGSIPIALVLMLKGLSPGAALLLLMAGPATNVASMVLLTKELGWRNTFIYLASITFSAALFGFMVNTFISAEWILNSLPVNVAEENTHGISILNISAAVALALLLIYALFNLYLKPIIQKKK